MPSSVPYLFEPDEDPITVDRMCGLEQPTPEEEADHQHDLDVRRHLTDFDHQLLPIRGMRSPDRADDKALARGGFSSSLAPARTPNREAA